MIQDVDDERIWRKHDNEVMKLIIIAIDEKAMYGKSFELQNFCNNVAKAICSA